MGYTEVNGCGIRQHILSRNKTTEKKETFTQEDQTFSGRKTFLSGITTSDIEAREVNVTEKLTINGNDITQIINYLPNDVSELNKLTTENFVNSSIGTNTAYFRGTFNSLAELEAYAGEKTNNDYVFVIGTDLNGNTVYNRYKYNSKDEEWVFEYALNNSSFTSEQWAAINSGITEELVAQIGQGGGGVPVGTIHHYIGIVAPEGYLMCDKSYNATDYPQLWAVLPDSLKNFDTGTFDIDFRELVIVGAGQNEKLNIKAHDVYNIGEFKDDQFQGHRHSNRGQISEGNSDGKYKADVTLNTKSVKEMTGNPITDGINGTPRVGSTTHGKQIGLNYIIKY